MSISRLRLENNSLFHYIKDKVLASSFSEELKEETLVYSSQYSRYSPDSPMVPSPISDGRGWVYFDDSLVDGLRVVDTSTEQTSKVKVYDATDTLISSVDYSVNYKFGAISKLGGNDPVKVSYFWNYVSVLPYWPNTVPPPLPLVTITIDFSEKKGFQLGPGTRNVRTVYFNIFATSTEERDDLSEVIHDSIHDRRADILDFSAGGFLKYDGTFNTDVVPISSIGTMFFFETSQRNIHITDDFSDLQSYRSVVTGVYESFVEGS